MKFDIDLMRCSSKWGDVCILNVKTRKMKSFIEHQDSLEKPVRKLKLRHKLGHSLEGTSCLC